MRHAYGSSPQWAYPVSSFPRTIGIVLVALAVGAIAGATVVFSFVDRPPGQPSVAARSPAVPIQAASTLLGETPKGQADLRSAVQSESAKESGFDADAESGVAGAPRIGSATPGPARTEILAQTGSATGDVVARAGAAPSSVAEKPPVVAPVDKPVLPPADKKVTKKHHAAMRYAWRGSPFGSPPGEYHTNGIWGRY
jgi:hypothetical protein